MLYREAGQFKASYAEDARIFPIRQDRIGFWVLMLVFGVAVPLLADQYWLKAILIPVLIFSSLISADHKAILVFWRCKHPLPGSRAFSVHAPADHRIDLTKLKKNVGEFPVGERDQNAKWYGLYKQVDSDPSVVDSHKNYLLFRDIAAMSLLLVPIVPAVMYFSGLDTPRILISTAWFLGQYLVAAFAARTTGIRFVQNVLAVHASRKVTNSRKKEADG